MKHATRFRGKVFLAIASKGRPARRFLCALAFALIASGGNARADAFGDLFGNAPLFPHCLSLRADFVWNGWLPNEAAALDYYTEGIQYLRFEGRFTHEIPFVPELFFQYETNFLPDSHQEELLAVHNSASAIESVYSKIKLAAGFGKRLEFFSPNRSNSFFDISYTKETFYIQVSANAGGLAYAPFGPGQPVALGRGEPLGMFTKFEEINGTFRTEGKAILPMIYSLLFMEETQDIFELGSGWETRFGGYYAAFQKPYMVSQAASEGDVSGNAEYIYNAQFNSVGIVERYGFLAEWFEFAFQHNLGVAWVSLRANEALRDTASLLFFHYKAAPLVAVHIPLASSRIEFTATASVEWGFIWGGQFNISSLKFDTTGFFNDDLIFKVSASAAVRI
jgi:hypothetical protein